MKYDPIGAYLQDQNKQRLELSFDEIEQLVGKLPKSAYAPQFWANAGGYHISRRRNWLGAGYRAFFRAEKPSVEFVRAEVEPERVEDGIVGPRDWSEDELRACVLAYRELLDDQAAGKTLRKTDLRNSVLPALNRRTGPAYEYRMQNITAVMKDLGLETVEGYPPLGNIGAPRAVIIELIADIFGDRQELSNATSDAEELATRVLAIRTIRVLGADVPPPPGNMHVQKKEQVANRFVRDPKVVAWVLDFALGVCECCGNPGPFSTANGEPYLEVHHVRHLSDGGPDTTTNAIACCPNCHKELHHSADHVDLRRRTIRKIDRLQDFPAVKP